jgi:hypothetical protein
VVGWHRSAKLRCVDLAALAAVTSAAAAAVAVINQGGTWMKSGRKWLTTRRHRAGGSGEGRSVAVAVGPSAPTGDLPAEVRGREDLLRELWRALRRGSGRAVVLAGTGGVGKSTLAKALAERGQRGGPGRWAGRVWWVSATDAVSLTDGLVAVAHALGATAGDVQAIADARTGNGDVSHAAGRLWALLNSSRRRWLLLFDNADDPPVLAPWLRPARRGLVVVTSRNTNPVAWGRYARVVPVRPLNDHDAVLVLRDWAPRAGDEAQALPVAQRLGGLPLALRLAGAYLGDGTGRVTTFRDYRAALDGRQGAPRMLMPAPGVDVTPDPRTNIVDVSETSLDALDARGIPQARPLLRLLSCYAAGIEIPSDVLAPDGTAGLLGVGPAQPQADMRRRLDEGLRHLKNYSLVEVRPLDGLVGGYGLVVHPVIADVNREHLDSALRGVAVQLVVDAAAGLDFDLPADWPRFRLLTPHLIALCHTATPDLDPGLLRALLEVITLTARAHNVSGAAVAGELLPRSTLDYLASVADESVLLALRHDLAWQVAQSRPAEAERMYRQGLAVRRRLLGGDHPDTLLSLHEVAWITAVQGRWADAETQYRDVLDARQRVLGEDHLDTLMTRHELGWAIANQGRGTEAEPILREVLATRLQRLGADHPRTLATRHELAWIAADAGQWAPAEAQYRQVLDAQRRVLGPDHPSMLTTWHELAWVLAGQGRRRAASAEYRVVLAARRRVLGDEHPHTIQTSEAIQRLRRGQITPARHIA